MYCLYVTACYYVCILIRGGATLAKRETTIRTKYLLSYCYMCPLHAAIYTLILLNISLSSRSLARQGKQLYTTTVYKCQHTTIYVCAYTYARPRDAGKTDIYCYICVLILLYILLYESAYSMISALHIETVVVYVLHTSAYVSIRQYTCITYTTTVCVSSCTTTYTSPICVSSYY